MQNSNSSLSDTKICRYQQALQISLEMERKNNHCKDVAEGHSFWPEKKVDEFFILMKCGTITYKMKLQFTDSKLEFSWLTCQKAQEDFEVWTPLEEKVCVCVCVCVCVWCVCLTERSREAAEREGGYGYECLANGAKPQGELQGRKRLRRQRIQ